MALLLIVLVSLHMMAQSTAKKPRLPKTAGAVQGAPDNPSKQPTEATVNEFMRHTFGYEPNLKWRVAEIKPSADPSMSEVTVVLNTPDGQQTLRMFVTPDQKYAISGDFVPFGADPYLPSRQVLARDMNGPSRGPADAPVTIVEFGDLQCPACKRAQPTIEKLMSDVPNVKLVFQQFPLVQIHKWAMTAAKYGLCVAKQNNDAYWKFVDTVYQHQDEMQQLTEEQVAPKLKAYAGEAGVNADQAEKCTSDPEIAVKINNSLSLGRELDVTGTPTLFVGGRKIGNVSAIPYETLKAITEFQAQSGK
jgi:protein-disulfide isomerase